MRITSSLFSQNVAFTLAYSTITLYDRTKVAVKSTTFKNNSALAGGALIAVDQCQVTLTNCTFASNKATTGKTANARKFLIPERNSYSFDENKTYKPIDPTKFKKTSSTFLHRAVHNQDQNNTGSFTPRSLALLNQPSVRKKITSHRVHLLVRRSSSRKNSAQRKGILTGFGGAVNLASQSQLLVTNCVFENNSADAEGTIAAQQNVTLDIQGTTFVGNKALYGGAISVQQQAQLLMTNCVFENNSCQQLGGAIHCKESITLDIHKTNFRSNSASQGGAIDIDTDAHLHVTDCIFTDNYAGQGAAIGLGYDAILEINGSYFSENSASDVAGGIIALNNVMLDIHGTSFVGNKALKFGGAIVAQENAILNIRETTFARNKASGDFAGAINVEQQAHVRVKNCLFDENVAQQRGGTIYGVTNVILEIEGTNFTRNSVIDGGAIHVRDHVELSLSNCRLEFNSASDTGGAVMAQYNVKIEIRETNFTGNSVVNQGGALCIYSPAECYIVTSVFRGNAAKAIGGAIYIDSKSLLNVKNTIFTSNNGSAGGGIYIAGNSKSRGSFYSTTVIENCHFLSNNALTSGGAINLNNPEHVSMSYTSFLRNVASDTGGAISIRAGTVTIDNIGCVGNQVPGGGGCLMIDSATLTLNNSYIGENDDVGVYASDSRIQVGFLPLPADIPFVKSLTFIIIDYCWLVKVSLSIIKGGWHIIFWEMVEGGPLVLL